MRLGAWDRCFEKRTRYPTLTWLDKLEPGVCLKQVDFLTPCLLSEIPCMKTRKRCTNTSFLYVAILHHSTESRAMSSHHKATNLAIEGAKISSSNSCATSERHEKTKESTEDVFLQYPSPCQIHIK